MRKRTIRLGDVTDNFDSLRKPVKKTERVAGEFPYYGASGVVDHVDNYIFDGEYLLIAEDGENLRSRSTPIAFMAAGKFWVNNHAHVVRGNHLADTRFLNYLLAITDISGYLTGSAQPKLSRASMDSIQISLPDLDTQRAIAEVLGALDDKIAANNRAFRIVEYLGVAKFTQLGLDEESQNAPVPFADFFEVNPRRTVTSDAPITVNMQALPTTGPLINSWSRGKRKGGARFTNGDTLLARITPCLENRKTAYVDFLNADEVGIGSTEFIVLRSKEGLPLGLSYFMAISSRFRDFAIQNMVGTSGRQRVSAQDLERYSLSPIDRSHLQEFGEWADINLAYLGSLRDENNALSATRDALLPQLMSGKIRVRDAEAVVEDVL